MLAPARTRTVTSPLPIDLRRTVGPLRVGARDPVMHVEGHHAWRASHTPDGPATAHYRSVDATTVEVEAWGPGADWVLATATGFVGADDDLAGFDPTLHGAVDRAAHRHPGLRVARSGLVADYLVQTILGQKVTGGQAHRAWYGLVRGHGEPAPGPRDRPLGRRRWPLRLPPTMAQVGRLPYWAFHPLGVEQRRAEVVIRSARRIDRLEEAAGMSFDDAFTRLTALPGLGPWTAGILLRQCLGHADAVEVGDYHIKDMVAHSLAGETRGSDDRMLELLEPWAGHRGRVVMLLKHGGARKPTFGPKMAPQLVEDL